MEEQITELKDELREHKEAQKEMVETWNTARGVLKFIKFLAAIGLPTTVILAWLISLKTGT